MTPNIMLSYDQGKNSHGEMRRNSLTLAGYELELLSHSRVLLGIPQYARTLTLCMATNHQTRRKANLREGYEAFQACPHCANPHHTGRDCPQTPSRYHGYYDQGGKGGKGKGKGPVQYHDQGQGTLGRLHRGARGRGKANKGSKGGKGAQGQVSGKGQNYGKGLAPTQVFYIQHCATFNSAANA